MIPKRAIFFWEGPPMSWLRRQSIETFKACNPEWEVELIDAGDLPIAKNGLLSLVHRSDWARYIELATAGGVYFDTDIAFHRAIPDDWLDAELLLSRFPDDARRVAHIATMGCSPNEPFFRDAAELCRKKVERGALLGYQELGVHTLNTAKTLLANRDIKWIAADVLLPIPWDQTERLWNPYFGPLPPLSVGVHWFGGDHLSMTVERTAGEDWLYESQSIVAKAITKAREGHRQAE